MYDTYSQAGSEANSSQAFSTYFTITDRQLGGGASGRVLMALDHMERRQLACKIINLASLSQDSPNRGRLWREVELLSKTSHVRIMLQRSSKLTVSLSLIS